MNSSDKNELETNAFKVNGFEICKSFLDPIAVERIRLETQGIFIRQMIYLGIAKNFDEGLTSFNQFMFYFFEKWPEIFMNCGKQAQHLIALHRLALLPEIEQKLCDLGMQAPIISTRPVLFFNSRHTAKVESYWKTPPHQDWSSMQGSIDSVVAWIPLVDMKSELGPIEIIPGSHHAGLLNNKKVPGGFGNITDARFQDDKLFVPVELELGDVVFFSSFLVHRSGTNSTDGFRWSCHFRYNNLAEDTFIKRGYPHAYIYKPIDTLLTPSFDTLDAIKSVFGEPTDSNI
jgi:hypothetical protein